MGPSMTSDERFSNVETTDSATVSTSILIPYTDDIPHITYFGTHGKAYGSGRKYPKVAERECPGKIKGKIHRKPLISFHT